MLIQRQRLLRRPAGHGLEQRLRSAAPLAEPIKDIAQGTFLHRFADVRLYPEDPTESSDESSDEGQEEVGLSLDCGGCEADFALDDLESTAGNQTSDTEVQRAPDGGTAPAKPRIGTTCVIPVSFGRFFQGTAPSPAPFAAFTKLNYTVQDGRIACTQDRGASWVDTSRVTADGQRSGGTSATVSACQTNFDNGNRWYRWRPSGKCAAHDALTSGFRADKRDECESVIGAGLDTVGATSASMLLRHESYHVQLGCHLAFEGNARIDAGADPATVRQGVVTAHNTLQPQYDADSGHSCNAGGQSNWESRIDDPTTHFLP